MRRWLLVVAWLPIASCALTADAETLSVGCRQHHATDFGIDLEGDARRYAPDRVVDVLHIRLDVTPDFLRRTVRGKTRIVFQPITNTVTQLTLDGVKLKIGPVTSDHGVAEVVNDDRHVTIRFERPVEPGTQAFVELDHTAEPTRGLYFRTPEMGYPASDIQVWSQGETHEARYWFPCVDYPNDRSTTEVICHVPADLTVLSNGSKVSETTDAEGLKRVEWRQDIPHANYLMCLVAGRFERWEKRHRDIPLGFYAPPSLAAHAENAFQDTARIMAFYEQEIGVPFPWPKYDQVCLHDFIAGGMENTTLTTLTEGTIQSSDTETLRPSFPLDAHEMAHQWFGDYVTCKDWGHLWLNEGFATYYTHLYTGHRDGEDVMKYELFKDADEAILPHSRDKRAIVYRDYKNPGEQFDYRSYPKGSWVLHMLRSQLGPELYRTCIRDYLLKHALGNVVSDDLRQVVEQHSGRSFDRFFDQWVYHGGTPELKVRFEWLAEEKLARLSVEQQQEVNADILLFEIPAQVRFVVDDQVIDRPCLITQKSQTFYFALPKQPQTVRFDPHGTVLASVDFEKPEAMYEVDLQRTDDVLGRLIAVRALSKRGTEAAVSRLQQALQEDPFYGVRIEASRGLRRIDSPASRLALQSAADQLDARVRAQVIADISHDYHNDGLKRWQELWQRERNPLIRADLIRALGARDANESRQWLLETLTTPSFRERLADAAMDAMTDQRRAIYRRPLIQWIESHSAPSACPATHVLAHALRSLAEISQDNRGRRLARPVLDSCLDDARLDVRIAAVESLGILGDRAAAPVLSNLVRTSSSDRLRRAAENALQRLNQSAESAPREVRELREQVQKLQAANESLQQDVKTIRDQLRAITAPPAANTPPSNP